jgi:hypothetical protein
MNRGENAEMDSRSSGSRAESSVADACGQPPPALLLKGIGQFNEGLYWTCHETLEALWRVERRPVRDLYQGILQIGVGFHHLRRGNYAGAVKVLGRGLARLEGFPEMCQGVRVAELSIAARRVFERVVALGPDRVEAFDVSSLPLVQMAAPREHPVENA